jgi:hypothetical protein
MLGFGDSARAGAHYKTVTTCERPAPLPTHLIEGFLDE